jgi:hypothetical protein
MRAEASSLRKADSTARSPAAAPEEPTSCARPQDDCHVVPGDGCTYREPPETGHGTSMLGLGERAARGLSCRRAGGRADELDERDRPR